jgi:DNA-binding MarR family transcriptional regulator
MVMKQSSLRSQQSQEPALGELASDLQVVMARLVRRLRQAHETGDLSLSELSALARLEQSGPLQPGQLAEQERVAPQAMSVIVATLADHGLLARGVDSDDGRRVVLSATDTGRQLLDGRRTAKAKRLVAALRDELAPDELDALADALSLLDRVAARL